MTVTSHSPERGYERIRGGPRTQSYAEDYGDESSSWGRERSRRSAPRTQSYADDYNDWRHTQEDNNSRRHERKSRQSSNPFNSGPSFSSGSSSRPRYTPTPAPSNLPDYYAILRVSPSATPDQIRKAAKIRRIAVHPDTMRRKAAQQGKKLSKADEERIDRVAKEVGEAAEVLENITSKMDYDATR